MNSMDRDFRISDPVQAKPHTDAAFDGDRQGIVEEIGLRLIFVRMTRSQRLRAFTPSNLEHA
jgi:hypothetical protein